MSSHSLYSPSSSNRWLKCTASVHFHKDLGTNKWADEGLKAHELAEKLLRERFKFNKR